MVGIKETHSQGQKEERRGTGCRLGENLVSPTCDWLSSGQSEEMSLAQRVSVSLSLSEKHAYGKKSKITACWPRKQFVSLNKRHFLLSADGPSFHPQTLSTTCFHPQPPPHRVTSAEEKRCFPEHPQPLSRSPVLQRSSRQKLISLLIDNSLGKV